jgi:hypothetical protein
MSLIDHPISQPSLDISPSRTPVIAAEVKELQLRPVWIEWENCVFYVGTLQRIYFATDDIPSVSTLVLGLMRLEFF